MCTKIALDHYHLLIVFLGIIHSNSSLDFNSGCYIQKISNLHNMALASPAALC